jgi:hypothetical protein
LRGEGVNFGSLGDATLRYAFSPADEHLILRSGLLAASRRMR